MPTLYKLQFIDSAWFKTEYNTAFEAQWDALNPDEQERFIEFAATRVKRIANRPFVDLKDLELEQGSAVQVAMGRLIDYWLEYGLDLNRISGSVSLGSFSASQTAPNDPDYIPEAVYEVLQDVNLYTPVGYINERDLYRADDENAITYGVRFKGLERVKDITILKSEKELNDKRNIDLKLPTLAAVTESVNNIIKHSSVNTHKQIIGSVAVTSTADMNSKVSAFNAGTPLTLTTGATFDNALAAVGDVIFFNFPGTQPSEEAVIEATDALVVQTANNATADRITQLESSVTASLNARPTQTEADARYIKVDGSNTMSPSYNPSSAKSVATKDYIDSIAEDIKSKIPADGSTQAPIDAYTKTEVDGKIGSVQSQIDAVKAQSDLDHADLATVKTTANQAKAEADDWMSEKIHLVRRDELVNTTTVEAFGRPFARVGTSGDIYEAALNTVFNGHPAMNFSAITDHPRAVIGITRQFTTAGTTIVRTNSMADPKWNDSSAEGTDTVYLASDLTSADKVAHVVSVKAAPDKITVEFPNGLTAGQRDVFLSYSVYGLEFQDTGAGTSTVGASDETARQLARAAQTTANGAKSTADTAMHQITTVSGLLANKQASLNPSQLAILAGVPFTSALKTKYDGYDSALSNKAINNDSSLKTTSKHINGADGAINELKDAVDAKQAALTVEQLAVLAGNAYTVAEKNRVAIIDLTDLPNGDAIFNAVVKGKEYLMSVDANKQYLMQGLCISKSGSQATFVGYSWNTAAKHTNTVWATADAGRTSGDKLAFNGLSTADILADDNAIANVASLKASFNKEMAVTFEDGTTGTYHLKG